MYNYDEQYQKLLRFVLNRYGVTELEILGSSRKANIAEARQMFAYCLRIFFHLSFPVIGKLINRDHTTIMHACTKMNMLIDKDSKIKHFVERISSILEIEEFEVVDNYYQDEEKEEKIIEEEVEDIEDSDHLIPKFIEDVEEYDFPVKFNEYYFNDVISVLNKRTRSVLIERYAFFNGGFSTLDKISTSFNVSRQRIKQIIDKALNKIYKNNIEGVRQIVVLLTEELISKNIISVNNFVNKIFIFEDKDKNAAIKFVFMISSIVPWIKDFNLAGRKFFIDVKEENNIIEHIDEIKKIINSIDKTIPDTEEHIWDYIYKKLTSNEYFVKFPNFLDNELLRACYDNYLFESDIIINRKESSKKYNIKIDKNKKKIDGVPNEYNVFFQ